MKKKLFLIYLMLFPIPGLSQTRDAFIRRSIEALGTYRGSEVRVAPVRKTVSAAEPPAPAADTDGTFRFAFYGREFRVHYDRKDDSLLARECLQIRDKNQLCDWAFLQLVDSLSTAIYPTRPNEREMLFGFLLGQAGYRVRFGTSGHALSCLYSPRQIIYAKSYFPGDGNSYWYAHVPGEGAWSLSDPRPGKPLDLTLTALPMVGGPVLEHHVSAAGVEFDWRIPQALLDFYASYPHTEMAVKADAPVSRAFREAAYPALKEALAGKGEVESVNKLLRFVWGVMEYRKDQQYWGHEKWSFPEESCFWQVGDCDDHAILFCRLVRDLLGLDVLLVECQVNGVPHAAAAVRFNESLEGESIQYEGQRYFCCEPTSGMARAGQRMWKKYQVTKIAKVR